MAWQRLPWAKMPSNWIIKEKALREFHAGEFGLCVAALKVYIAILSEVRHDDPSLGLGQASVSFTQLQEIAGLSRSMIHPALERLRKLVTIARGHDRVHIYTVLGYPARGEAGWAMVPTGRLAKLKVLEHLSARSKVDFAALKLYLLLAAFRDVKTGEASIAYETIQQYSGLNRNEISRAMSRLVELDVLRVHSGRDARTPSNVGYNRYDLLGLSRRQASTESREDTAVNLDASNEFQVSRMGSIGDAVMPF